MLTDPGSTGFNREPRFLTIGLTGPLEGGSLDRHARIPTGSFLGIAFVSDYAARPWYASWVALRLPVTMSMILGMSAVF